MGGRGRFVQTFKVVVYGLTPYCLLGWIPIVGGFGGLRGLVVEIFGIASSSGAIPVVSVPS